MTCGTSVAKSAPLLKSLVFSGLICFMEKEEKNIRWQKVKVLRSLGKMHQRYTSGHQGLSGARASQMDLLKNSHGT